MYVCICIFTYICLCVCQGSQPVIKTDFLSTILLIHSTKTSIWNKTLSFVHKTLTCWNACVLWRVKKNPIINVIKAAARGCEWLRWVQDLSEQRRTVWTGANSRTLAVPLSASSHADTQQAAPQCDRWRRSRPAAPTKGRATHQSSTHTGEHTAATGSSRSPPTPHHPPSFSLSLDASVHLVCLWAHFTSLLLSPAGREDEGHAGDLLDSAARSGSQRSGLEIRPMPQTRGPGQLWRLQGKWASSLHRFPLRPVPALTGAREILCLCLQYIGKWYEIMKLPTAFQKGQCGTATYSSKGPGVIGVFNSELLWVHISKKH